MMAADLFAPVAAQEAVRECEGATIAFSLAGHRLQAVDAERWAEMKRSSSMATREACGSVRLDGKLHVILSDCAPPTLSTAKLLTRRELQIARCIAEGASNKEIARRLGISHLTVREHVRRICAKLSLHSRAAVAARIGAEHADWLL